MQFVFEKIDLLNYLNGMLVTTEVFISKELVNEIYFL